MANSLKESKQLLNGWRKFYLTEARAKKPAAPEATGASSAPTEKPDLVIRIFDFDGTLYVDNQNISKYTVLRNPFMAAFLPEKKLQALTKGGAMKVSPAIMKVLEDSDAGKIVVNRVLTMVGSTGFPKPSFEYALKNLQKDDLDANFRALANVTGLPTSTEVDDEAGRSYTTVDLSPEELADWVKNNLRVSLGGAGEESSPSFSEKNIDVDTTVRVQDEKYDLFLKANKKLASVLPSAPVIIPNTAKRVEDPITGKMSEGKGTSTKGPKAAEIVSRIMSEHPEAKTIRVELYDNSDTAIKQMEVAILNVGAQEPSEEKEAVNEEGAIKNLRAALEIGVHNEGITVARFQTKIQPDGDVAVNDLAGAHLTRQKDKSGDTSPEGAAKFKFQRIKNKLRTLTVFLKSGGQSGRPQREKVAAFDAAVEELKDLPLVKNLIEQIAPRGKTSTTGKEEEYSNLEELNKLREELKKFISTSRYQQFKNTMASKLKTSGTTQTTGTPEEPEPAGPDEDRPLTPAEQAALDKEEKALRETILSELKPLLKKLGRIKR